MRSLRVGVVGLGVGLEHVRGYHGHASCDVVLACDLDPAREEAVRAVDPGISFTTREEDVLTDPEIDVVSIATFDAVHARQTIRALDHGKHVFVEKPVCVTEEERRDLCAALERNPGLRISTNLILRRFPRFLDLKRRIDAGEMGELYSLEADYNYGRLHKITEGWRGHEEAYSVVLGGGIHMVDFLIWLKGLRIVEVMAYGNRICSRGTAFQFEDLVTAIMKFEDDSIAKISCNFGCVHPHFHRVAIYGTEATFLHQLEGSQFLTSRDLDDPIERPDLPYPGVSKAGILELFIDSILGEGPLPIRPDEIFHGLAVCLAIDRAMAIGRPVSMEVS